jgi:transposase
MAALRISMNMLRQIIHQIQENRAIKEISRSTGVARNTIRHYRDKLLTIGISQDELSSLSDPALIALFTSPKVAEDDRKATFLTLVDDLLAELKQPFVTKRILWEEYIERYPDGYRYAQFCLHLSAQEKARKISFIGTHIPGDKIFIDFAGDKLSYFDKDQNIEVKCEILVGTLGFSNYTLVEALPNQKEDNVAISVSGFIIDLGGSPNAIVPDNMKSAVTKPNRYEPTINNIFLMMANHYKMSVMPARVRKPKDKAKVERAVNHVYQRVYAALRKRQFYSLEELNRAIREEVENLNNRPMQQYGVSRKTLFELHEKAQLSPLPDTPFTLQQHYSLKVQSNSHVYMGGRKQYFSVPHQYIGQQVLVIETTKLVQIYLKGECIATHTPRIEQRYHTQHDHLSSSHRAYQDSLDTDKIIQQADEIDSVVGQVIRNVLLRQIYHEQANKTCTGIIRLEKLMGRQVLIESCIIALEHDVTSYKRISSIAENLKNNIRPNTQSGGSLPNHANIRGANAYQ